MPAASLMNTGDDWSGNRRLVLLTNRKLFSPVNLNDAMKSHRDCIMKIRRSQPRGGGGGVLPYMSYIGMCRYEGYGFQRVYSRIGYRNQRVLV